jgi:hypothetical protein
MIGVSGTDMRYGDGTVLVMGGTTLIVVGVNCYHTLQRTNTENWKQIFQEKELRGNSPNFHLHVSVSDLYIPMIDLPILPQKICGPILGMYQLLTGI